MAEGAPVPDRFRGFRRFSGIFALAIWGIVMLFFGATIIRGGSMEPSIAPGDIVIYKRSAKALEPGDIVLFEHPEWPHGVVHRVREVLPDGRIVTRGDANPVADREPLDRRQIRGVATLVLPSGKAARAVTEALR
jgi:signal peptidase I